MVPKNEKANFNWFPGHMNKTIKQIEHMVSVVDLVIEIVDARAPFSTQNPLFRKILSQRPRLIVFAKGDLADEKNTAEWIEYYRSIDNEIFHLNAQKKDISKDIEKLIFKMTEAKQKRDKARGIEKPNINVLVIGIPNVGKSSFISKIAKGKYVKAGNTPGVTRGLQRIALTKQITLIDTPGILPSKFENESVACTCAATNSIKLEVIPKERFIGRAVRYIYNSYPNLLETFYKINPPVSRPIDIDDSLKIIEEIAKKRKYYLLDDLVDSSRAMDVVFRDLNANKYGRISFEKVIEIPEINEALNKEEETFDLDFNSDDDKTIEW